MHALNYLLALAAAVRGGQASLLDVTPLQLFKRINLPSPSHSLSPENSVAWSSSNTSGVLNQLSSRSNVPCSETIGAQPIVCSAPICGGEDPKNLGHCVNKNIAGGQCQCMKGSSSPSLTTVTATQSPSNKIVIGTYALQTISSYSGLRQSITTTITTTTTASGETTGVETAAAVIMAGGVTWIPSGFVGDAVAAEAVLKAPETAEGHKDDNTCPNPEKMCSDCGGVQNMCATGVATGCACEETSCPTGDSQPKCSDEKCKPDANNKCTGENPGCTCEPNPECPDGFDTPFCSDCGGGINGKCLGIKDQNYKWKDCDCMDDETAAIGPRDLFGGDVTMLSKIADKFAALPPITDASYSSDPDQIDPVCQKAGWAAPQRDTDGTPSVTSKINEWCTTMDGKTVSKQPNGVDTAFSMYLSLGNSFWLSASNWYYAPEANQCSNIATISKAECISSLLWAMETCDPNTGLTHGASFPGKCINFNITLDNSIDPQSPPWHRLPSSASPQCDTSQLSGVQNNFFSGLYPKFCTSVDANKAKALKGVLTNSDFHSSTQKRSRSASSILVRTPPPSANQYAGYNFHFDWTGGDSGCREDCSAAFKEIMNSPCGNSGGSQNGMTTKGSINVGCGTYSYEIEAPADVSCMPGKTPNAGYQVPPVANPSSAFPAAAYQFCNGGYNWVAQAGKGFSAANYFWFDTTSIDPATNLPAYCLGAAYGTVSQWSPPSQKLCKASAGGLDNSNSKIVVQVIPSTDQTGCAALRDHTLPTGTGCINMFANVISQCMPAGNTAGTDGYFTEKSADGCWDWWIFGRQLT